MLATQEQLLAMAPLDTTMIKPAQRGRRSRWDRPTHKRRGRFGPPEEKPFLPPPFIDLPGNLNADEIDQFLREQRLEELTRKIQIGELELGDADIRGPSPPPIYDRNGNRTNTRDVRSRAQMLAEQQRLVEYMLKHVQGYLPPPDLKPLKKIRRIMIPQDQFPDYNFMGLIIGPRGCNHKRLEAESGAQVSIRGRGTLKEGKRTDHQTDEEANLPQHVHIAADTEEKVEKAVSLIEPLLDPFHPMHEEFKKKGLEQLALVNGTGGTVAKTEMRCTVCGLEGHFSWECPEAHFQTFKRADVRCALCGDLGHVTMDCKLARERHLTTEDCRQLDEMVRRRMAAPAGESGPEMDQEYSKMMSEITGRGARPNPIDYDQRAGITVGNEGLPQPPAMMSSQRRLGLGHPSRGGTAAAQQLMAGVAQDASLWGPVPPPKHVVDQLTHQSGNWGRVDDGSAIWGLPAAPGSSPVQPPQLTAVPPPARPPPVPGNFTTSPNPPQAGWS